MSDPLKNLSAGDPLPTSARTWNPLLEMARARKTSAIPNSSGFPADNRSQTIVYVRNQGPFDLSIAEPTLITGLYNPPTAGATVMQQPVFTGNVYGPTEAVGVREQLLNSCVVAMEPIKRNTIGRCVKSGVVSAKINITDPTANNVTIWPGAPAISGGSIPRRAQFNSSNFGFPVLWKESGTGTKWAVINLDPETIPRTAIVYTGAALALGVNQNQTNTVENWFNPLIFNYTSCPISFASNKLVFEREARFLVNFRGKITAQWTMGSDSNEVVPRIWVSVQPVTTSGFSAPASLSGLQGWSLYDITQTFGGKKGYSRPEHGFVDCWFYFETYQGTTLGTKMTATRHATDSGPSLGISLTDMQYVFHELDTTYLLQGSVTGVVGGGPQLFTAPDLLGSGTGTVSPVTPPGGD